MPSLSVVDMEGKNVGTVELAESVFGIEPNAHVMHMMVVNYLAAQRQGTQSALTRAEVSGGGKKPWRQKGTGRAETKGHRPRPSGFDKSSPVDSRRRSVRSQAPQLQIHC